MTEQGSDASGGPGSPGSPADPASWREAAFAGPPRRSIFELEDRAAPGLYFAGWLLTVVGCGSLFVALAASGGGLGTFLLGVGGLVALTLGLIAAAGAQGLQRKADGITGYAGPSPFLVLAAALTGSLLVSALLSATRLGGGETPLGLLVGVLISGAFYVGLVGLLVVGTGALTWAEMGIRRPTSRALAGDLGSGFALGIVALFATAFVAAILVALLGVEPVGPVPIPTSFFDEVVDLLAAAIVAPVVEEVFFRGFATTAWARRIGPSRAILRGALFFAIVHVLTIGGADASEAVRIAMIAFVARIPVALLLGWVFVRRDSLWASIALHATFNGVALVLADLAGRTVTGG